MTIHRKWNENRLGIVNAFDGFKTKITAFLAEPNIIAAPDVVASRWEKKTETMWL